MIQKLLTILADGPESLAEVSRTAIRYFDSEVVLLVNGAQSDLKYARRFLIKLAIFAVLAVFSLTLMSVGLALLVIKVAEGTPILFFVLALGLISTLGAVACLLFAARDGGRVGAVVRNFSSSDSQL